MKILLTVFVAAMIASSLFEVLTWSTSGLVVLCGFTAAYFYRLKLGN